MLGRTQGADKARHLDFLMMSSLSPIASPLGMPHGAAAFMGTCHGDQMDCVSGVAMPEALKGEGGMSVGVWVGAGAEAVAWV